MIIRSFYGEDLTIISIYAPINNKVSICMKQKLIDLKEKQDFQK